jgi:heptaprenyl diphosphate synthase
MMRWHTDRPHAGPAVLGYYVALAAALQVLEGLFPTIIPGVKLGAANIVTLFVLSVFGFRAALTVALVRPVVAALATGTLASPMFLISITASVVATVCMAAVGFLGGRHLSHVGVSMVGAVAHNVIQLAVAGVLFLRSSVVWMLAPILVVAGVAVGWITGSLVNTAAAVMPLRPVPRARPGAHRSVPVPGAPAGFDGVPYAVLWLGMMLVCIVVLALSRDLRVVAVCIAGVAVVRVLSRWVFPVSGCRGASRKGIRIFLGIILGLGMMHGVALALRDGGIRDPLAAVEAWALASVKFGLFVLVSGSLTASRALYRWLGGMPVVTAALESMDGLLHRVPAAVSAGLQPMLTMMLVRDVFDESADNNRPVAGSDGTRDGTQERTHDPQG